jgi:CheY-like chemotaxis protein
VGDKDATGGRLGPRKGCVTDGRRGYPGASSMDPRLKILVVSNAADGREEITLALGDAGFDARAASTFELKFAVALEQPDLVLVDVARMEGDEVASLLKDGAPTVVAILFADRPLSDLRGIAASCRASWYFCKPSTASEIAGEVDSFVRQRQAGLGVSPEPAPRVDPVSLARQSTRSQFITACRFPLLVGKSSDVARPRRPRTAAVLDPDILREVASQPPPSFRAPAMLALAICKARETPLDWITVGRAPDADLVIEHATLSSIHAHFLPSASGLQLADAGSLNGTWVAGRFLEPNGPPSPILESGDSVRFGELEFTFLSPNSAWDTLRVNVK